MSGAPSAITIKITGPTEIRRFSVPIRSKYATIQHLASRSFGLDKATPIKLKYKDDEGDLVTMSR